VSPDSWASARVRTRVAVLGLAVDLYGEAVVIERSLEGLTTTVSDVQALAGVGASRQVRDQAIQRMRDYAELARGEGTSWAELGLVLGVVDEGEGEWVRAPRSPAEAAFAFVAEGRRPTLMLTGGSGAGRVRRRRGGRVGVVGVGSPIVVPASPTRARVSRATVRIARGGGLRWLLVALTSPAMTRAQTGARPGRGARVKASRGVPGESRGGGCAGVVASAGGR